MPSKNAKPRWGNYGVGFMPAYHLSKNDEKALCKELSRILKKDVTDDFLNTFKGLISSYRRRRHQEKLEPKNTEVAEELKQLRKAVQPLLAHSTQRDAKMRAHNPKPKQLTQSNRFPNEASSSSAHPKRSGRR
jgi:hypothetical protein